MKGQILQSISTLISTTYPHICCNVSALHKNMSHKYESGHCVMSTHQSSLSLLVAKEKLDSHSLAVLESESKNSC